MKVKIIVVEIGKKADALIREGAKSEIPSWHDDWYFDLAKQLKRLPNATGYFLVKEETPNIAEGCMMFQLAPILEIADGRVTHCLRNTFLKLWKRRKIGRAHV